MPDVLIRVTDLGDTQSVVGEPSQEIIVSPGELGPIGPRGLQGISAYNVAVVNGFVGTEAEWLDSLIGLDGDDGPSAYDLAVEAGFPGNVSQWLASLHGAQGNPGDPGEPGDPGADGRELELQAAGDMLQWRYVGDPAWTDLFDLSTLSGGGAGTVTSVEGIAPDVDGNVDLGLGTAAAANTGDFEPAGAIADEVTRADAAYDAIGAAAVVQAVIDAHLADSTGAHAAAAISFTPTGSIAASDVQSAVAEVASEAAAAVASEATARDAAIAAAIAALVASAPGVLDTLDEIAAALGDDPNFAATITTALAGKQPLDAELSAVAALTSAANKLPYFSGSGTASLTDFTAFARTLLADADAATMRATLGLDTAATHPATDFQAADAELSAIAGLTSAADKAPYFTGSGAAALMTVSSFIRTLLDDADAATARTTLGLGTAATVDTGTASGNVPLLSTGGRLPIARVASGTPDGTKFVRDDGTLAAPDGGGSVAEDTHWVIDMAAYGVTTHLTGNALLEFSSLLSNWTVTGSEMFSNGSQNESVSFWGWWGPGTFQIDMVGVPSGNRAILTWDVENDDGSYSTVGTVDWSVGSGVTNKPLAFTMPAGVATVKRRRLRAKAATKSGGSSSYYIDITKLYVTKTAV